MAKRILVTEKIDEEGIGSLLSKGYEVDQILDASPDQLLEIIGDYDALIVRSATKVTDELLDAAKNLKVIGRAGVTVDNIDLVSASEHGVVVCNAPTSNIISAAEHTMALLLSAARKVPQANTSMHDHKWDRHDFIGTELYGKTLAIFGLGRIGSAVAQRARAFGMNVIAYDPFCNPERAEKLGVELYESIDDILPIADVISVHLPRTSDTLGMFGAQEFAKMKDGVILVNSARGGIYDIDSLADFIAAGKVKAAAIDIFEDEPCLDSPLHDLDAAVLTPHISAVTKEAQRNAGTQIAEYVWQALEGSIVPTAINPSVLPPEVLDKMRPYVPACKMVGKTISQISKRNPSSMVFKLQGELEDVDPSPMIAGVLSGLVGYKDLGRISYEDALSVAERHGISVDVEIDTESDEYVSSVTVDCDGVEVGVTLFGVDKVPHFISLLGYNIDINPAGRSLIFEYEDKPGRIGVIGTILGRNEINITTMQIGTKSKNRDALVFMNIEGEVTNEVIGELKENIDLKNIWVLNI